MTSSCYWLGGLLAFGLLCQMTPCWAAHVNQGIPEAFDYSAYLAKYQKAYGLVEATARAKLFYKRTLDIFKANLLYAAHEKGHYLHQNEYIDQTQDEVKQMLSNSNNDLVPVVEAQISPDTPADQFIQNRASSTEINDLMTKSSLDELTSTPVDHSANVPTIDFFSDSDEYPDLEPSKLVQELRSQSKLAKEMSKLIEIEPGEDLGYERDLAKKSKDVAFKPVIDVTNKKYDPSLVETRGFAENPNKFNEFYANMMMDDFLGYLEPYPAPSEQHTYENNDADRGILSGFLESVKTFRDHFIMADDDELENREGKSKLNAEVVGAAKDLESDKKTGIVYNIDWRKSGCLSRLKNQAKCNSCYAFATLDLIEYFYCREMGVATEFSAQYLIDCGAKAGLSGCQGGKLSSVRTFIDTYGLQVDSLYPYVARDQVCPYDESEQHKASIVRPTIKRWAMFSDIQAWYKWVAKSPIIVGINMPSDFLAYGGGIHNGLDCTPGMVHALLLVGAGKEDGKPFWLLKNTFSDEWGEGGYFRLSRKAPIKCFNSAVVARVTFKDAQ